MTREKSSQTELLEQLLNERQLLRMVIDSLPDGIYVKDLESRFVVGNEAVAHLIGVDTPDDLIGKTDFDFFDHNLAQRYYDDEQAVIRSGQSLLNREEPTFDARTGTSGWLLTTKVIWHDRQGDIAGIIGIGRNITELKQTREALAQANAELERRVYERTAELSNSKASLERVHEFFRSTLEQLADVVNRGAPKNELMEYVRQAQGQFKRVG
ncbi:MAG: PAS domain-containing protein [Anaerolineae bacterium]